LVVERDMKPVAACRKQVSRLQAKYERRRYREWSKCYASEVRGLSCDVTGTQARIAGEAAKVRDGLGGIKDSVCSGGGLTPESLGHGGACPAPCAGIVLAGMADLATCALCLGDALSTGAL